MRRIYRMYLLCKRFLLHYTRLQPGGLIVSADPTLLRVDMGTGGGLIPLPQWAIDIWEIGRQLGELDLADSVQVTALALPRLEYAAGIAAAGVTSTRLNRHEWSDEETKQHLERIASLPLESPVFLRRGNRVLNGIFMGVDALHDGNAQLLRVQVENAEGGSTRHLVPARDAQRILVAPTYARLPKRQKGRRAGKFSRFISEWYGKESAKTHIERRRVDVVVLGARTRVLRELSEDFLALRSGEHTRKGSLSELIRPLDLMPKREGYASRILSARPAAATSSWLPADCVMIFDGASAFMRARPLSVDRSTLVLLSRGEPRFYDAVDVLDRMGAGGPNEFRRYRRNLCPTGTGEN